MSLKASILLSLYFYSANAQTTFNWTSIEPSANLTWVSCFSNGAQCARLAVPFNYSDPSVGTAAIAMIRYPSPLAGTAQYRGPILFNPGGPGGSGVEFIRAEGSTLATVVGPQFDILGFDPRGIASSTPPIGIFSSDAERALWDWNQDLLDADGKNIPTLWARAQILGTLAKKNYGFIPYATTDNVARDMLAIVQAHGKQKLNYWGFSYGTTLGATFATLFPDKVERLIIDGVMDFAGYYNTDWSKHDLDTEKSLQYFIDQCHAAGASRCPFYADSPTQISQRLNALFDKVKAQPVPVYNSGDPVYGVLDYERVKNAIFGCLYSPPSSYLSLAEGLAELERGNGTILFKLSPPNRANEFVGAIACTDGKKFNNDAAGLQEYYAGFKDSSIFASVLGQIRVSCSGWQIHNQFTQQIGGKTSFPLLVISNTADPITPHIDGVAAAEAFEGAVLLTHDAGGHTSTAMPSPCTLGAVALYFQNGTLPEPGTVCPAPTDSLFPAAGGSNSTVPLPNLKLRHFF